MKRTQELLVNDERKTFQKELKEKDEVIEKMKLRLTEKDKNIDEKTNKYKDLSEQMLNIKEKYNIKEKDYQSLISTANEKINKNDIKDLNYGKHNFAIFYDKVRDFAEGLYNYTGMK